MTLFTQIFNQNLKQGKLMVAVSLGKKGPKNTSSNDPNRLEFGNICRKNLLFTKIEKMNFTNLTIVAL